MLDIAGGILIAAFVIGMFALGRKIFIEKDTNIGTVTGIVTMLIAILLACGIIFR